MEETPAEILVVEDDPFDVDLLREALRKAPFRVKLHVVTDGEKALAYLNRDAPYEDAVRPDLVLLDLNLPRKSGREVLEEVKSDPDLHHIPVLVLSTSDSDSDVAESYRAGANCYLIKPFGIHQTEQMVRAIENFWLCTARLSPRNVNPRPYRFRGTDDSGRYAAL